MVSLRILFIDAVNPLNELETRYPSLGLGYLSSYLKEKLGKRAIKTKVIYANLAQEIKAFRPHILGIRAVSQNYNRAKEYAKIGKKANLPVIIGGIHITSLPQTLTQNMDIGVLGEGEITFYKLIKHFQKTGRFSPSGLKKIPGIVFWQGKKLSFTPPAPLLTNLDALPFPDREILQIRPHTYMFTSRGCPFRCRFCASSRFWQNLRFFSAEYVAAEIEELIKKYKVRFISFYDDLFIADLDRVEKLVALLEKKKILGKVKFSCSARAELITPKSASLLKKMGIASVGMGLESGTNEILRFLKGKTASVEKNARAIKILHQYGIRANASFIIGSPQETKAQILKTLDFIRKNDLDFADTYLLTPFPGTPIWDEAKKKGLVSEDMDWSLLNVNFQQQPEKAIILSEKLTRQQLWELYQKFRRQRLLIALKKIWRQPYLIDIPRYLYQTILAKIKLWGSGRFIKKA